jgi:signal transduction histidine kinase
MSLNLKFPHKKRNFKEFLFHSLHQIQNSVQLMRIKWDLSDNGKDKKYVEGIKQQLRYLSLYMQKLSDVYDRKSPRIILDVVSMTRKVCAEFLPLASHEFEKNLPRKILLVKAKPFLLEETLRMILENAVKFTPEGEKIHLKLSKSEDFIIVCLKNTGVGIKDSERERIFEEHYQVDANKSGVGLGLYLVKKIIALHDGSVEVHSDGDSFFEIVITLPRVFP